MRSRHSLVSQQFPLQLEWKDTLIGFSLVICGCPAHALFGYRLPIVNILRRSRTFPIFLRRLQRRGGMVFCFNCCQTGIVSNQMIRQSDRCVLPNWPPRLPCGSWCVAMPSYLIFVSYQQESTHDGNVLSLLAPSFCVHHTRRHH